MHTIEDVQRWVAAGQQPQFMLPARFRNASFDSFEIADDHPEHQALFERARTFVADARPRRRRFWDRGTNDSGKGLFFVGPPGVGKTHLLAAAFKFADDPKLFATFDELVAAAGPLGMQRLNALVSEPDVICIDEVVLEDPGNITMLVTLLHHMVDAGANVFATANMPPEEAGGEGGWMQSFERELGSIAAVFDVVRIAGPDRRVDRNTAAANRTPREGPDLQVTWSELDRYLIDTHPMHDAGWLQQVRQVTVTTPTVPPPDKDRALRFIRFIDRVYDRDVQLVLSKPVPDIDTLVAPLADDPRYIWHVARGTSRLKALLNNPG